MVPDMYVAGHRLAVQAYVVQRGAEEHVQKFVFPRFNGEFILVAVDLGPTVSSAIRVSYRSIVSVRCLPIRARLMQPARLGDSDPANTFVPVHDVQERDLSCQWELALKRKVGLSPPKEQAPRERQQVQLSLKIGALNRGRQLCKRPERQKVLYPFQRLPIRQEILSRPLRKRSL